MRLPLAFRFCRVLLLLLLPCIAGSAQAAITTLRLTTDYSDFCIHPVSGDVAAISLSDDHIHLFRNADLAAGKKEPAAKLRVGSTPCGICFKRYEQLEVFAVICEKDSYLYLLDAKTGALHRKVELPGSQVHHIATSLDPNDPHLFYYYGHQISGVVSLKDYKCHDLEFFEGAVAAISASGRTAYINERRNGRGYGAMSLARDATFLEFQPLNESEVHSRDCLPDPFDRFVAMGSLIYTRSLEKREAELNFTPLCFWSKKPLVFGVVQDRPTIEKEKSSVLLQAASYNTFSASGKTVVLEPDDVYPPVPKRSAKPKPDPAIEALYNMEMPRGMPLLETKRENIRYKLRILADEPRNRIIVAYRSRWDFVPLEEFETPAEPLLLAKVEGETTAFAGREWSGSLQPADPAAEVVFSDLPTGMKGTGNKLTWTPSADQIGPQKFGVTLKHKDIQRLLSFEIDVVYPSLVLPFVPTELGVSPDGSLALLSNCALSRWQRQRGDRDRPAQPVVTLLDLKTDKVLASKKMGAAMRFAALTNNLVAMIHEENQERCEILNLKTLGREKTLVAESQILTVQPYGKLLLLNTATGMEFYEPATFQLVKRLQLHHEFRHGEMPPFEFTPAGLGMFGVRYDWELKPQLFQKNFYFASFDKHDELTERERERMALRLMQLRREIDGERPHHFGNQRERELAGATRETVDGVTVDASLRQKETNFHSIRNLRQTTELSLTARGQATGTQLLARNSIPLNRSGDDQDVLLTLSESGEALVSHNGRLYRWPIPKAAPEQAGTGDQLRPVEFVPRQSALALSGTGTTTLKHQVQHGSKPYKFLLTRSRAGITIDEKTGDVTIDEKLVLADAAAHLQGEFEDNGHYEPRARMLQQAVEFMSTYTTQALGIKPRGFPFAIPLEVTVQDAQNQESTLSYYVLADIPLEPLLEKFKKQDEELKAKLAEERKPVRDPRQPEQGAHDIEALLKRLDTLEQRLDLNTRQLNQVLKLLEEKNNSK